MIESVKIMNARDREFALLSRCVATAQGTLHGISDQTDANVFYLASMVIKSSFPKESNILRQASEQYFEAHPNEKIHPSDVINKGWIFSLPRLRDMLTRML